MVLVSVSESESRFCISKNHQPCIGLCLCLCIFGIKASLYDTNINTDTFIPIIGIGSIGKNWFITLYWYCYQYLYLYKFLRVYVYAYRYCYDTDISIGIDKSISGQHYILQNDSYAECQGITGP